MASLLPSDLYAGVYKSIVADPQAVRLQREQEARSQAERGELLRKQAQQAELEKVLGGVQQGDPQALSRFMQLDPKGAMEYQDAQDKRNKEKAWEETFGKFLGVQNEFGPKPLPEQNPFFQQLLGQDPTKAKTVHEVMTPKIPEAPKVGTLEAFIVGKYGPSPTAAQQASAKAEWDALGGSGDKPPSGYRWTPNGTLEPIPGGPASEERKPPTSTQFLAAGYGRRLEQAALDMDRLAKTFDPSQPLVSLTRKLPDWAKGSQLKQQEQAERNFINAVLRRESGAAIAESEFENARRQYFPQANDSKELLEQKKRNREQVLQSFKAEAGKAWAKVPLVTAQRLTPQEAAELAELEALEGGN